MQDWLRFQTERDAVRAGSALRELFHATQRGENTIRPVIEAWKADASIGEIMGVVREALGFPYDQFEMVPRPAHIRYD